MARIIIEDLSLEYPILDSRAASLKHKIFDAGIGGVISRKINKPTTVKALEKISIKLKDGDRVGLVGHNGSGKSSLLRAIAGIYEPTAGTIRTDGEISTLFSLNAGVSLELTGLENVARISALLGQSREESERNVESIVSFTELGDFISAPVRTYSLGMMARLLFAISTSINPDILLIDEVILAGDTNFQKKAEERIHSFIGKASILVMASHSKEIINRYCNRTIELRRGRMVSSAETSGCLVEDNK